MSVYAPALTSIALLFIDFSRIATVCVKQFSWLRSAFHALLDDAMTRGTKCYGESRESKDAIRAKLASKQITSRYYDNKGKPHFLTREEMARISTSELCCEACMFLDVAFVH